MIAARMLGPLLVLALLAAPAGGQWVEDSLLVGGRCDYSMAYNSASCVVYGTSSGDRFYAIDCATNSLLVYDSLWLPAGVVYDSVDNKAYCPFTYGIGRDSLLVIDGTSHSRIRAVHVTWAHFLVWSPDYNRLYVTPFDCESLTVLDCRADTVLCWLQVGLAACLPTLNRRYRKLYVADWEDLCIRIIDLESNRVIRTLPAGLDPDCAWYSETAGRYFYGCGDLLVVDGAVDTVIAEFAVPGSPRAISEIPELGRLVVACGFPGEPDSVFVLDIATGVIVSRLVAGASPYRLRRSPASGLLYCVNRWTHDVTVIAPDGSRVIATVSVSYAPMDIVFAPSARRAYVSHLGRSYVYAVRDTAGTPGIESPQHARPAAGLRVAPSHFRDAVSVTWPSEVRQVTRLGIYSLEGRLVRVLLPCGEPGASSAVWDGTDADGREVCPGVYMVGMSSGHVNPVRMVKLE